MAQIAKKKGLQKITAAASMTSKCKKCRRPNHLQKAAFLVCHAELAHSSLKTDWPAISWQLCSISITTLAR